MSKFGYNYVKTVNVLRCALTLPKLRNESEIRHNKQLALGNSTLTGGLFHNFVNRLANFWLEIEC